MSPAPAPKRASVLDPPERASEVIFGVLMAVSFTGTLSPWRAGLTMVAIGAALVATIIALGGFR